MPLGPGVRYRYKKGTHVRLAFKGDEVVEAKNMKTGETHMMAARLTQLKKEGKLKTGRPKKKKGKKPDMPMRGGSGMGHSGY